jgi:hypothetical protein
MNILSRKTSENPFYGQKELLTLYTRGSAKCPKSELLQLLNNAWKAVIENIELRRMLFVIIFSFGDITNRQHQIFGKNQVDQGGAAWREGFNWSLEWMKLNTYPQYLRFVFSDSIRQFIGFFAIFNLRVKTTKKTNKVEEVINTLKDVNLVETAKYVANLIKTSRNPVELILIAKWLTGVRTSKRQKRDKTGKLVGSRPLLKETLRNAVQKEAFYKALSDEMGWQYIQHPHNIQFTGLRDWKKQYNSDLESVLFSTGKIVEFDETQFKTWLNSLPAGARYRVRRRLLDKDDKSKAKWFSKFANTDLAKWFLEWEKFKETKQVEQKVLTEKVRQGVATEDDKKKLEKVTKEAKVTVGGQSLFDELTELFAGKQVSTVTLESIINKVKFEVPVLTISDCSGSMGGRATAIARVLTTLTMIKNPSNELDNILVTFGSESKIYTDRSKGIESPNRFTAGRQIIVEKLVDRTKTFLENLENVSRFIHSNDGSTNFSSVAREFKRWLDSASPEEKEYRKEYIRKFPVFLVITDGDLNNQHNAEASMREFQQNMLQWFGWDGVVVIWDTVTSSDRSSSKFANLENVIHYTGWNLGVVNTIFTKIHDLDVIDIYTPLLSLYRSNRYDLIKGNVI